MAIGKIACFKQLLLLSKCFQKSSATEAFESVCIRERVIEICHIFTPYDLPFPTYNKSAADHFEIITEKNWNSL